MSLADAIKSSNLESLIQLIGPYTLTTDLSSNGSWQIYLSNGDSVLSVDLGNKEIDELQKKLGLTNKQGVVNLIGAALRDLQQPPTAPNAPLTLSLPPVSDATVTLNPPTDQSAARRRLFALLSSRAKDLSVKLQTSRRDLEAARASNYSGASTALGLARQLGAAAGGGVGAGGRRQVRSSAQPGMSLLNPMQRKRGPAKGIVFDDEDDEDGNKEEDEQEKKEDVKKNTPSKSSKSRKS